MLVFIAFLLLVYVGLIAFSVDVAYMHLSRTQLQTASDAAARAAGEALTRTQDLNLARQAAKDIAAMNYVDGQPLLLDDSDIINGNSVKQADGKWLFTENATPINAFRITGRKLDNSPSGAVNLIFGPIFGHDTYQLTSKAASVRVDRDICLVVDRSSSMKLWVDEPDHGMWYWDWRFCNPPQPGSRFDALADAVDVFIAELQKTPQKEYLGLASYASTGSWCYYYNSIAEINQQLNEDVNLTANAMTALSNSMFNGNTAIGEGINKGIEALTNSNYARPYAKKTIVLMTDGIHNTGVDPITAANSAASQGIVIYTVTFGDVADQATMQQVAQITGGKHYHAPDEQALIAAFKEIALSLSVILTE